jgi:hypothetical protein
MFYFVVLLVFLGIIASGLSKLKKKYGVSANSVAEPKKIGLGVFDDSEESERKKKKKRR